MAVSSVGICQWRVSVYGALPQSISVAPKKGSAGVRSVTDKKVFDVHVIVSATHLDEEPRFLVTVFQSVGDQVVRFAIKTR
jgi:hypothetical protein